MMTDVGRQSRLSSQATEPSVPLSRPDGFDPGRVEAAIKSLTPAGRLFLAGVSESGCYQNNGGQTFSIGNGLRTRGIANDWQWESGRRGEIGLTPLGKAVRAAIAGEARSGETVKQGSTGTASTRAEGIAHD